MILRLLNQDELPTILPLVQMLNTDLSLSQLEARLREMIPQGYQCLGAFQDHNLVGIAGLWIRTHFWCGRMIEPDNVCVHPNYRSQGIGEAMMQWIFQYGLELSCEVTDLNCYASNFAGQKFWMNQGYRILGFHFQRKL